MRQLFRFSQTFQQDPAITRWMAEHDSPLGHLAQFWFEVMRQCGADVGEILHDGHPTACVEHAAFAYVNHFTAHVNVGFFHGADLPDPCGLLQGSGKYMRHVKLKPGVDIEANVLRALIETAYRDIKERLARDGSA